MSGTSRLVEFQTFNSSIARDYVMTICNDYEINCDDSFDAEVTKLLLKYGILKKHDEKTVGGYVLDAKVLLNKDITEELNRELEKMGKYIILLTEPDNEFYEIIKVEDEEENIKFLLDFLKNQEVREH
ncbi:MAG: hypothetical protein QXT03_05660 [Desulfurococcaceae archaeon]